MTHLYGASIIKSRTAISFFWYKHTQCKCNGSAPTPIRTICNTKALHPNHRLCVQL